MDLEQAYTNVMKLDSEAVDKFIANYSPDVQVILQQTRAAIREAAPEAEEKIGYGIPTFTLNGNLIHFSGFDKHIGLYPGPVAVEAFQDELKGYETAKGTIRFPLDKPMPYELIQRITEFCVEQNSQKAKRRG